MSNKDFNILIRVSKEEKKLLNKKAEEAGISSSEYIRQLINHGDVKIVPTSVVVDLRRIGINFNQIARRINIGTVSKNEVIFELSLLIEELKKINLR